MRSYTYCNDSVGYIKPKGQGDVVYVKSRTQVTVLMKQEIKHKWHVTTYIWSTYQSPALLK